MPLPIYSANTAWEKILDAILKEGEMVNPPQRGELNSGKTLELVGYQSPWVDMKRPLVTNPIRKISPTFAAAEAWWILSGSNSLTSIAQYNKVMEKFSDDGRTLFGAYGPKLEEQMENVLHVLRSDLQSRQAVVNIWRENPPASKDIPCTVNLQWLVRGDKVHCIDTMRSSDIWLGWPYDVFTFSMVTWAIVAELNRHLARKVEVGNLRLNAGSQHLYYRDLPKATPALCAPERRMEFLIPPNEIGSWYDLTTTLKAHADKTKAFFTY